MADLSYIIYCTEQVRKFGTCQTSNAQGDATDDVKAALQRLYQVDSLNIIVSTADDGTKTITLKNG